MNEEHSLPPQGVFLHALLRHLADYPNGDRRGNIQQAMPKLVGLSEAQRVDLLASGRPRHCYRSGWGLSMLKAAGYLDSPSVGVWRIAARGRELLAAHPNGFDEDTARRVIRESRGTTPAPGLPEALGTDSRTPIPQQSPEERIDDAAKEIEQAVARELLDRILQALPDFFERLVIELLNALGYGTGPSDSKSLGGVGDGGIDGVIALDRLGLDKVYVQAKRWQGSVGRPQVQAFFGALAGRRAKKGVFITTSTFTKEAREYGEQMSETVVLIDGATLTRLMIEHGVAVTHDHVVRVPRLDQGYFDTA